MNEAPPMGTQSIHRFIFLFYDFMINIICSYNKNTLINYGFSSLYMIYFRYASMPVEFLNFELRTLKETTVKIESVPKMRMGV
jgi:hypothetical protein